MNARPLLHLVALAALASSTALAQQPQQPQPPTPSAQAPAPVERRPPGPPGMMHGGQQGRPNFRGVGSGMSHRHRRHRGFRPGMMAKGHSGPEGFRDGFRGGPEGGRGMMPGGGMGMAGGGMRMAGGGMRMEGGFHIGPPGMWWKNPAIVQRLTLTADQSKKMDDIFQASRLRLVDLKANLEKQELMLQPMLAANPPDTAKALVEIDKVAQARADLEKENAKMLLGIRGVLTPDQWTKLQTHDRPAPDAAAPPSGPRQPGGGPGGPGGRGQRGRFPVEMDDTRP
jgi:Spy/CpxP family protein refolding chaperone